MKGLVLLLFAVWGAQAQIAPSSDLILIPFQVTRKNAMVTDLRADEVEVRVDGAPQKLEVFEGTRGQPRTIPVEVCFLFDCERMILATGGLTPRMYHELLLDGRDHVRVSIYGFSGGLVRLTGPTREESALKKALETGFFVHPLGTFLLDQIIQVAQDASSSGRAVRMLLAISDGVSDAAPASQLAKRDRFEATVQAAWQANMSVHPVVLRQPFGSQASTSGAAPSTGRAGVPRVGAVEESGTATDLRSLGDFTNLASATGGQTQDVLAGTSFLPGLLKYAAKLIQDNYVAGFAAARSDRPKRHRIEVVLKDKSRGKVVQTARTATF